MINRWKSLTKRAELTKVALFATLLAWSAIRDTGNEAWRGGWYGFLEMRVRWLDGWVVSHHSGDCTM